MSTNINTTSIDHSSARIRSLAQKLRHNPDCIETQHRLMEARMERSISLGLIVSAEDVEVLYNYTWSLIKGYAQYSWTDENGKTHVRQLQQLVHARMTGQDVTDTSLYNRKRTVRHIEGNQPLNCRRDNIHAEQGAAANQREVNKNLSSNNTTGVSGVSFQKKTKRYQLQLAVTGPVDSVNVYLGLYESLEEASFVRNSCVELRASFPQDTDALTIKVTLQAHAKLLRASWAEMVAASEEDDFFDKEVA